jgi:hypothetical protein
MGRRLGLWGFGWGGVRGVGNLCLDCVGLAQISGGACGAHHETDVALRGQKGWVHLWSAAGHQHVLPRGRDLPHGHRTHRRRLHRVSNPGRLTTVNIAVVPKLFPAVGRFGTA